MSRFGSMKRVRTKHGGSPFKWRSKGGMSSGKLRSGKYRSSKKTSF